MKRRDFIKQATATVVVAALPYSLLLGSRFDLADVSWAASSFDHRGSWGIAISHGEGKDRIRNAVRVDKPPEEITQTDIDNAKAFLLEWLEEHLS